MHRVTRTWLTDVAERVVATFIITALSTWLLAPTLDHDIIKSAITAGIVAAGTLAKTLFTTLLNGTPSAVPGTSTTNIPGVITK